MLNFGQVSRNILEVTAYIRRSLFPPETEKTPLSRAIFRSILILQENVGDELVWNLIVSESSSVIYREFSIINTVKSEMC